MKKKIIIVGAGPSGVAAALKLIKSKKYEVFIFEKENEVGGISRTINYKGNKIDIGGHRFFTKDEEVLNFWKEIMPLQGKKAFDEKEENIYEGEKDPNKEDNVLLKRRRISRIYYMNKFFEYPIKINKTTIKNLGIINTIKCAFSYLKACIIKKKETNLENFYINRFGNRLYEMFFKTYTYKVWGKYPNEIDASWGKQRIKGISIKAVIKNALGLTKEKETSLIEEFYYPKYGPGQMYTEIAKQFQQLGGKLFLNYKLISINKDFNTATFKAKNKIEKYKFDYIISSIPIVDLLNTFDFKVPKNIKEISNNLPYRSFITIGLLCKKINIKNNSKYITLGNIIPDCWIYIQDKNIKMGRLQIFNNWSPYLIKNNKTNDKIWLGLEYFADEDDNFYNKPKKELIEFGINELEKMNFLSKENVLDSICIKQEKAYPAYFNSYKNFDKVKEYLNKFENLYCIGRNGQHRYNNMDHSIMTGLECAKNIINNNKDKANIWNINTKEEYHEEKNNKNIKRI